LLALPIIDPRAFNQLAPDARAAMLATLLDQLNAFARQADTWPNLERFPLAASHGSEAGWRFEVRKTAAERMRMILMTIAGRELLAAKSGSGNRRPQNQEADRAPQRSAFEALLRCESLEPGAQPPARSETPIVTRASFPTLS
jgi:hypothetical protein